MSARFEVVSGHCHRFMSASIEDHSCVAIQKCRYVWLNICTEFLEKLSEYHLIFLNQCIRNAILTKVKQPKCRKSRKNTVRLGINVAYPIHLTYRVSIENTVCFHFLILVPQCGVTKFIESCE